MANPDADGHPLEELRGYAWDPGGAQARREITAALDAEAAAAMAALMPVVVRRLQGRDWRVHPLDGPGTAVIVTGDGRRFLVTVRESPARPGDMVCRSCAWGGCTTHPGDPYRCAT